MTEDQKLSVYRTIDKKDRIGWFGVYELLTGGRKDQSGAFTPGIGLDGATALYLIGAICLMSTESKDFDIGLRVKAFLEDEEETSI